MMGGFTAVAAFDVGGDFLGRKNETIIPRVVRCFLLFLMKFEEGGGVLHLRGFARAALSLDGVEAFESLLKLAGEALRVDAEVGEVAGLGAEGEGGGERGVNLRIGGVDGVLVFGESEGKEVGFEGGDAVESPGGVGDFMDELFFEGAFGLEVVEEFLSVELVGGEVVGGEDDGVAGESVAEGIEGAFGWLLRGGRVGGRVIGGGGLVVGVEGLHDGCPFGCRITCR